MSTMIVLIIGFSVVAACCANNNLQTKYHWKTIDFAYEQPAERQEAIERKTFIPENVIPVGLDVHENRLFLSLPRLKAGVPASLAYINMKELTEDDSPILKPYPSWQSHRSLTATDELDIVSPFHIKVDRCNRLWAVDTGIENILNGQEAKRRAPARILIYDLRTDNILRRVNLNGTHLDQSIYSNIAVDDNDCDDTFAYVADAGLKPSITVYSYKLDDAWQVKHNFFNIDPLTGNFSIVGVNYRTNDGVYGLALSEKKENGFPDLYFHSLTSTSEFSVSTAILRQKKISDASFSSEFYKDFKMVGSRGSNGQAGTSAYDKTHKIIFYTMPNMNEIGCWKTTNHNYNITKVYASPVNMAYPMDIKIDENDRIWVLSNNLQNFLNGQANQANDANYYVHFIPLKEAIKNTACETGFIEKTINKLNKALGSSGNNGSEVAQPATLVTILAAIVLSLKQLF